MNEHFCADMPQSTFYSAVWAHANPEAPQASIETADEPFSEAGVVADELLPMEAELAARANGMPDPEPEPEALTPEQRDWLRGTGSAEAVVPEDEPELCSSPNDPDAGAKARRNLARLNRKRLAAADAPAAEPIEATPFEETAAAALFPGLVDTAPVMERIPLATAAAAPSTPIAADPPSFGLSEGETTSSPAAAPAQQPEPEPIQAPAATSPAAGVRPGRVELYAGEAGSFTAKRQADGAWLFRAELRTENEPLMRRLISTLFEELLGDSERLAQALGRPTVQLNVMPRGTPAAVA